MFCSLAPFLGGIHFFYIVPPITSEPSICTSLGSNWDACPIRTLLKVVECIVSLLFGCHFFINIASWVGAVYWMWRWWLLFPNISSLLYLHVFDVFHVALFFGAGGQLKYSQGALVPRAPRMMGLSVFPPQTLFHVSGLDWGGLYVFLLQTLVHVSSPDWCTNGLFPILGLGPWALCCVWIIPSHNCINKIVNK